jgi:hypothetical protein
MFLLLKVYEKGAINRFILRYNFVKSVLSTKVLPKSADIYVYTQTTFSFFPPLGNVAKPTFPFFGAPGRAHQKRQRRLTQNLQ